MVKAAGAGLGHQWLMRDIGLELPVCVWTDSSAALGIAFRSGFGKLRHLETHTLWVQEKVRTCTISVRKVRGEVNPADLFTKHLPSREKVHQMMGLFSCECRSGKAESAPLPRPHGSSGQQGSHLADADPLPTFGVSSEGELQNWDRLPHMNSELEIDRMSPVMTVVPIQPKAADWEPEVEIVETRTREGHWTRELK